MIGTTGLTDLRVDCIVGIYEHERIKTQEVRIDVEIDYDFAPAAASDAIPDAIDYDSVAALLTTLLQTRQFQDLADVNRQVRQWLDEVANQRRHRETGQTPEQRFRPDCLRSLPALSPDFRKALLSRP